MSRREERKASFMLIFERCFNDEPIEKLQEMAKEFEIFDATDFSVKLARVVDDNKEQIDALIRENLKNRSFERTSKVNLSILRMAIGEILFIDDVPAKVSANEAVEIAKEYGDEKSPKFVNAVIGAVIEKLNNKQVNETNE